MPAYLKDNETKSFSCFTSIGFSPRNKISRTPTLNRWHEL
jgi:hypothetical protein